MPDSDEIFILDDDPSLGDMLAFVLESAGYRVTSFRSEETFTSVARLRAPACVLLDVYMPRRSGLEILRDLDARNYAAPIIIISGKATIPMAVEAMKIGAFDVVTKPFELDGFADRLRRLIEAWRRGREELSTAPAIGDFPGCQRLTRREHEVLAEIAAAASSKEAASKLGLSPRTVEVHRAHIMMKLGAKNAVDLMRLVMGSRKDD